MSAHSRVVCRLCLIFSKNNVLNQEEIMTRKSFQDYYPESLSHCYGCGPNNAHGLHISSFWDGDAAIATFHPQEFHLAFPGYVYGGLIASLIDCHCVGTAAAAAYREEGRELGALPHSGMLLAPSMWTISNQPHWDLPSKYGQWLRR